MGHAFRLGCALCALAIGVSAQARPGCASLGPDANWDDAAQFVSGLSNRAYAESLAEEQSGAWSGFAKSAGSDWIRLKRQYLDRIDTWRGKALGDAGKGGVAFYPFSGPDAVNVLAFFPDAREYVLVGLEPVGCIPSEAADYSPAYFSDLRQSLQSVVAVGFFKTEDMHRDFHQSEVTGVLPVLLFLVARAGFTIVDVTAVGITPDGALVSAASESKRETRGVAIRFKDERHGIRTLTYFSLNLQNSPLQRKPGTMRYLQRLPMTGTLVKSASYLMHKRYFSTIRGVILAQSSVVVEDDSGISFQFFDENNWKVNLYGKYTKPIALFKNYYQEDLDAAYSSRTDVQPLDFGIGYQWRRNESNLLVAMRKTK